MPPSAVMLPVRSLPVSVVIPSGRPPDAIVADLQGTLDERRPIRRANRLGFVPRLRGTVSPSIEILVDSIPDGRASRPLAPTARGRIEASPEGSTITVTIDVDPASVAAFRLGIAILVLAGVAVGSIGLWSAATSRGLAFGAWWLLVPFAAIACGIGVLRLQRKAGLVDATILLQALSDAAGASASTPGPESPSAPPSRPIGKHPDAPRAAE